MADTARMHPWFRLPTLKRKSPYRDRDDTAFPPPDHDEHEIGLPAKRRRCDVLERGLAQLSIAPVLLQQPLLPTPSPGAWNTVVEATSPVSVERHATVTEPEDTPIECDPEFEQQDQAWYEPEKDRTSHPISHSPAYKPG